MGFPLITVERDTNSGEIQLRQSRFKLYNNPDSARFANPKQGYVWNVPLWYRIGAGGETRQVWAKASSSGKCQTLVPKSH